MRILLLSLSIFFIISCKNEEKVEKPNWLYGKWKRTNNKPNTLTYDIWQKDLTGTGFTLKGKDTIFKEDMQIVSIKDTLFLKIDAVNENPTLFKFTKQTDSSFVCENAKNEFPKKIYYYLENNNLKCKIWNEEFAIDFIFEKIKQ